jgi:hypothetical protein
MALYDEISRSLVYILEAERELVKGDKQYFAGSRSISLGVGKSTVVTAQGS